MSKVRGNGTIYQLEKDKPKGKCRRWKLQVSLGRDLATGKYTKALRNVTGTYTEAQKALRDLIAEIENNTRAFKSSETFAEFAEEWIEGRKQTVECGTWSKNINHIKAANLHIAKARLNEITPAVLEKMYADLMDGKSPSGKELSGAYVNGIANTLHKMFADLVDNGKMPFNPCEKAKAPAIDTPERKALSIDEIHSLISKLDPTDPPQLVVLAGLKAGLRRGETHGLRWRSLDENIIYIRWTVDLTGVPKEKTKTRRSTRVLPLPPSLIDDFEARKEAMIKAGLPTGADDPIICNALGEYMHPHTSSDWWRYHRNEFGLDGWTIHEMRHSYLSELARRNVPPKVLQDLAGHESFRTTMDIYVHAGMNDKIKAVSAVDW